MCSKDDFLNWDDLDLDTLLVDYTDYDDTFTTDSVNSDSTVDYDAVADEYCGSTQPSFIGNTTTAAKATIKPKTMRRPCVYSCPVCVKKFRSPSGFRGHIIKKHPTFNRSSFKGNKVDFLLQYCYYC